jgi:hypothetical protein
MAVVVVELMILALVVMVAVVVELAVQTVRILWRAVPLLSLEDLQVVLV